MFDSSLITYAVSLHFSQKVNEIITSTSKATADETGKRARNDFKRNEERHKHNRKPD